MLAFYRANGWISRLPLPSQKYFFPRKSRDISPTPSIRKKTTEYSLILSARSATKKRKEIKAQEHNTGKSNKTLESYAGVAAENTARVAEAQGVFFFL